MEQFTYCQKDIVHLARLGLGGQYDDLRMYVARLVRRYRLKAPAFSKELESLMQTEAPLDDYRAFTRDSTLRLSRSVTQIPPHHSSQIEEPLLSSRVRDKINDLLDERQKTAILANNGLAPTSSVIFTGSPGVGKTMTAEWIADRLGLPMFRLDLAEAIGSHLGESGNNLKSAFMQVKDHPGILFLDEIDAIAKTRSDDSDIGEMKRLVTVLLQELDDRNSSSLILAATNNIELIDPAVWRRFEMRIDFPMPNKSQIKETIAKDLYLFRGVDEVPSQWLDILSILMEGAPFSEIRTDTAYIKKKSVLTQCTLKDSIMDYACKQVEHLPHRKRIDLAVALVESNSTSQRIAGKITGVSRQTIRNRINKQQVGGRA